MTVIRAVDFNRPCSVNQNVAALPALRSAAPVKGLMISDARRDLFHCPSSNATARWRQVIPTPVKPECERGVIFGISGLGAASSDALGPAGLAAGTLRPQTRAPIVADHLQPA